MTEKTEKLSVQLNDAFRHPFAFLDGKCHAAESCCRNHLGCRGRAGVSNEELMPLPTEMPSLGQEEAEEAVPAAAPGDDAGTSGEQLARLPAASPAPALDRSPSALYSRGMDLFRTGDFQSAIAFFNDALFQDPNFSAAYQLRGASYEAIGQLALALKDFDSLIGLSVGWTTLLEHYRAIASLGR